MNKIYLTGRVPVNKIYPTGTVLVNKNYPTGTVPVNEKHPTGTVPVNKNYPTLHSTDWRDQFFETRPRPTILTYKNLLQDQDREIVDANFWYETRLSQFF